jgi:hypothetical protein
LELTRAHDGEQTLDRAFAVVASRAEHDLAPLNSRAQGSLGRIVRGCDTLFVHEGEEVLIVHEERVRQVADVAIGGVEIPLALSSDRRN